MSLFGFLKKKPAVKVEMTGYENGRQVHLKNDVSDSSDWEKHLSISLTIKDEIKPIENIIVGFAVSLKDKQTVDNEILLLESLIENYADLKKRCYAFGPEYIEYFNITWDQVLKGKPDGPCYVTRYKKRLQYIRDNYQLLKEQENVYNTESNNLENKIVAILQRTDSILQTDIYKQFHSAVKPDIQSILYHMEKNGQIRREKFSRTYMVHYINK